MTAEESCGYQADVVAAVQSARADGVAQADLGPHIEASAPEWPANFNAMIPLVAPWVYEVPAEQFADADLAELWRARCLEQ